MINFISRSSGEFFKIIVCSFTTTDEPLYNLLESKNIELINDIDEVPELQEFDDKHEDKPTLIVFDDFINVEKKKLKKIYDYLLLVESLALVYGYYHRIMRVFHR